MGAINLWHLTEDKRRQVLHRRSKFGAQATLIDEFPTTEKKEPTIKEIVSFMKEHPYASPSGIAHVLGIDRKPLYRLRNKIKEGKI